MTAARIAYQLTQGALPRYSHPRSPHRFTLPQLAACVLMTFYLDLSYRDRDMEEFLLASEQVCRVLDLPRVPDHSTLSRTYNTYKKLRRVDFETMKGTLLSQVGVEEEVIASDSTGFSPSQASAYYQTRSGRAFREYVKGAYAVGTQSLFILAWRTGRGPSNDAPYLSGLRRVAVACRYGRYVGKRRAWVMLADAGFDGQSVQDGDLIPPIRRGGSLVDPDRKARAELVSAARLDGVYGMVSAGKPKRSTRSSNASSATPFGPVGAACKTASQLSKPWSTTSMFKSFCLNPVCLQLSRFQTEALDRAFDAAKGYPARS